MSQAKEMREQRCKLIADARTIMDSTETLDAEQRSAVDAMLNDSDTLKADIDRIEAIESEERQIKATAGSEGARVWLKIGHLTDVENQIARLKNA